MFIYKFLNEKGESLYIGKTNCLERRIFGEHLTSETHIDNSLYEIFSKIQYVEIESEVDAGILEAYMISKEKPMYNKEYNCETTIVLDQKHIENLDWQILDFDAFSSQEKRSIYKGLFEPSLQPIQCKYSFFQNQFLKGTLTVIAHRDSELLTYTGLNIINSFVDEKKILYVNLKESKNMITSKHLSISTGIDLSKILEGIHKLAIDEPYFTEAEIKMLIPFLSEEKFACSNCSNDTFNIMKVMSFFDIVIIDDINCLDCENNFSKDKYLLILKLLKQFAMKENKVIIGLFNYGHAERLSLNDIEYLSVQQLSDNVFTLYKNKESVYKDQFQFIHLKSITGITRAFDVLNSKNRMIELS